MALPKPHRLKGERRFQKLFAAGARHRSSHLLLVHRPAKTLRVGISVVGSLKLKSTLRNRCRRLLSHVFEEVRGSLPQAEIVVLLKALPEDLTALPKELTNLLRTSGLLPSSHAQVN